MWLPGAGFKRSVGPSSLRGALCLRFHSGNLPRRGNVSSIMRAVGARNTTF
jgi:hypothetical protein